MCKNIELIATCRLITTHSCQTRACLECKFGQLSHGWGASVRGEQAVRAQIQRLTEAQSTDLLCGTNPSQRTVRCQWHMVLNSTRSVTPRFGPGNADVRVSTAPRGCLAMTRQTYGAQGALTPNNDHLYKILRTKSNPLLGQSLKKTVG